MSALRMLKRSCESEIAYTILQSSMREQFPAIEKLSASIVHLLTIQENKQIFCDNKKIIAKLCEILFNPNNFGRLGNKPRKHISGIKLFNKIIAALSSGKNLPLTMHLHQVFMQHVFEHLPNKYLPASTDFEPRTFSQVVYTRLYSQGENWQTVKNEIAKKVFYNSMFVPSARLKTADNAIGERTNEIGLDPRTNLEFTAKTAYHTNVIDVFKPNPASEWVATMKQYDLDFLAGPSGHAGSLLLLATLAGNFDHGELKEYCAGIIGLLTGGGYHIIDEIGIVASTVGVPYTLTQYPTLLPDSLKSSAEYKQIQMSYQPLLKEVCTANSIIEKWAENLATCIPQLPLEAVSMIKFASLAKFGIGFFSRLQPMLALNSSAVTPRLS